MQQNNCATDKGQPNNTLCYEILNQHFMSQLKPIDHKQ